MNARHGSGTGKPWKTAPKSGCFARLLLTPRLVQLAEICEGSWFVRENCPDNYQYDAGFVENRSGAGATPSRTPIIEQFQRSSGSNVRQSFRWNHWGFRSDV
jgi:hypothetical protein